MVECTPREAEEWFVISWLLRTASYFHGGSIKLLHHWTKSVVGERKKKPAKGCVALQDLGPCWDLPVSPLRDEQLLTHWLQTNPPSLPPRPHCLTSSMAQNSWLPIEAPAATEQHQLFLENPQPQFKGISETFGFDKVHPEAHSDHFAASYNIISRSFME